MNYRYLWLALGLVTFLSFVILGFFGRQLYLQAPPIPERVISTDGEVLYTKQNIQHGQLVWLSIGGQELGTVWGHGAYLAPDWSADWLHREAVYILDDLAMQRYQKAYDKLGLGEQVFLRTEVQQLLRPNTFDPQTGDIIVQPIVAKAIKEVANYYKALFGEDPKVASERNSYAMPPNVVATPSQRHDLSAFYFWTAWACVTDRPNRPGVSYTNNWPAERLVGNAPLPALTVVSILSIVLLLAGIGALAWYYAFAHEEIHAPAEFPPPVILTSSMYATAKFFFVALVLLLMQVGFGVLTAHYATEGNAFFGFPLSRWLPYTVSRTWHIQTALFWIVTMLLATGLYMASMISGYEPKWQRYGVNFLWVCLVIIVGGSMIGEWLGIHHYLAPSWNFYFGHQGYAYVDLGRFWQIFLAVGLVLWLFLMFFALRPAFIRDSDSFHLLVLFFASCVAIGVFYSAGLLWGRYTNLAIAEYWRWWVVHLWVEGFFEVFTTIIIAFIFVYLGLIAINTATIACLFSTSLFLSGGVLGLFHHLYFTGTPEVIIMLGGVFSALEVVPLTLIGFDAYRNIKFSRAQAWMVAYKWPLYFFVAVCFWNLVGAGLLGFLINTPIALYYIQGLNTTPLHGHAALFGVYGNLALGLMLFCLQGLYRTKPWNDSTLAASFWLLNIGIGAQCFLSLMPVGLLQFWASINHDMWYARSIAITGSSLVQNLIWVRAIGDVCFGLGVITMIVAVANAWLRKGSYPISK